MTPYMRIGTGNFTRVKLPVSPFPLPFIIRANRDTKGIFCFRSYFLTSNGGQAPVCISKYNLTPTANIRSDSIVRHERLEKQRLDQNKLRPVLAHAEINLKILKSEKKNKRKLPDGTKSSAKTRVKDESILLQEKKRRILT